MTEVYVDVGAASIEVAPEVGSGGYGRSTEGSAAIAPADPAAVKALRYLSEAGVSVFVVATGGAVPSRELRDAADDVLDAVPDRPNAPAWYLTNDMERCQGSSARLRTVFVGGTPAGGAIRRCDTVARDVQAAAMEILAADAMAPVR